MNQASPHFCEIKRAVGDFALRVADGCSPREAARASGLNENTAVRLLDHPLMKLLILIHFLTRPIRRRSARRKSERHAGGPFSRPSTGKVRPAPSPQNPYFARPLQGDGEADAADDGAGPAPSGTASATDADAAAHRRRDTRQGTVRAISAQHAGPGRAGLAGPPFRPLAGSARAAMVMPPPVERAA